MKVRRQKILIFIFLEFSACEYGFDSNSISILFEEDFLESIKCLQALLG